MASSIPLHCNICPKLPKFSDLSHLLTHVASKGHLSHYFKAQVRSASEPSVRKELDAFDDWYDRHRIGKLMCQRMISKDAKSIKTEKHRHLKPGLIKQESKLVGADCAREQKKESAEVKRECVIDPQLAPVPVPSTGQQDDGDEVEFQGQITRPGVPYMSSRVAHETPKDRSSQPRADASFDPLPYPFLTSLNGTAKIEDEELAPVDEKTSIYPDPSTIQPLGYESKDIVPGVDLGSTGSSLTSVPSDSPEIEDLQSVAECSRLKGTIWPGMDLFDSANALAKRRRNQKKDGSMLAQMKWTSATVCPKEIVYTLDGNIHRVQPITGQVESSPFKQVTPKPKRVRARPKRKALAPVDSNTAQTKGIVQNSGPPRRRGRPRNVEPPETPTKPPRPAARKRPAPKPLKSPRPAPIDDDEVERQLALGEEATGQKKKMKIHQDACQLDVRVEETLAEEPDSFDSNEVYTYLEDSSSYTYSPYPATPGLTHLNSSFIPQPSHLNHTAFGSHSLSQGAPNPLHPANKENVKPMLNPLGRIDDSAANMQTCHNTQRYFDTQYTQSTHFFNTYPSNMPFGSYYSGGYPPGSYFPQVQYPAMIQHPYAPTMPAMNPLRPTCAPFQPLELPLHRSPPSHKRPHASRHLPSPSPQRTIVVDTSLPSSRRKGKSAKHLHSMTRPGGPGSEDGDSGDETIDEGVFMHGSMDDAIHESREQAECKKEHGILA